MKKKYKRMTLPMVKRVRDEVVSMLHCHRDTLRNRFLYDKDDKDASDPKKVTFDCRDGYYGEAFGVMRALAVLGYGYYGSCNLDAVDENMSDDPIHNLKWWFYQLERQVLNEENFGGSGECDWCLKKYGKDDSGRTRLSVA